MKISHPKTSNSKHNEIINRVHNWINNTVIAHNFCPFAKKVITEKSVNYLVVDDKALESQLHTLIEACIDLDNNNHNTETTLLIFSEDLRNFDTFLDALDIAEQLLEKQNYSGIYQLANFHPNYQFSGTSIDAVENMTNRSPYPIWQILREKSIEKVSQHYDLSTIPERNIEYCKKHLSDKI